MSTPDPSETGVDPSPGGDVYQENPDFVPDPTAATGTLDTSGTAGGDQTVETITPVFDAAKAQDLQYAAKALDPNDTSVDDPGAVVIENKDGRSEEEARDIVEAKAAAFREDPVKVQDPSITNAEENSEQVSKEDPAQTSARVQSEQQQAAPTGGNTLDTSDNSGAANAGATKSTSLPAPDAKAKGATGKK